MSESARQRRIDENERLRQAFEAVMSGRIVINARDVLRFFDDMIHRDLERQVNVTRAWYDADPGPKLP